MFLSWTVLWLNLFMMAFPDRVSHQQKQLLENRFSHEDTGMSYVIYKI